MNDQAYLQQKIGVYNSTFENLNYGQAIYSLGRTAENDKGVNHLHQSRGYVFTLYEYIGLIELINNTISKNMAFVPSSILSNN